MSIPERRNTVERLDRPSAYYVGKVELYNHPVIASRR